MMNSIETNISVSALHNVLKEFLQWNSIYAELLLIGQYSVLREKLEM